MKVLKTTSKSIPVPSRNEAFNSRGKASGRTKPLNITIDAGTLRDIDELCAEYNTSRSALIRVAIKALK